MVRKKLLKSKAILLSLIAATAITTLSIGTTKASAANIPMKSSIQIADDMGLGWNLGNTLDAHSEAPEGATDPEAFETCWGNPVTTKVMIDKIKENGFKTIRIPVTWMEHIGAAPEYKVDEAWMARVKEVVDYAMANDLYVILNVHHDSEWLVPSYAQEAVVTDKLQKLWAQITAVFKDYNDHLIFEAVNEVREMGSPVEWSGGTEEGRRVLNHYNAAAVNVIRNSGGNNDERSIMVPTYAASGCDAAIDGFVLPSSKNLMVSIHAYAPYNFAMNCYDENQKDNFDEEDRAQLKADLDKFYGKFVAKGIPVVIGEMGTTNKNNLQDRVEHAKYYISLAKERHIPCIWWDNGQHNIGAENFAIYDRMNCNWYFPELRNALINAYNSTSFR